jgi:cytidylate kinase
MQVMNSPRKLFLPVAGAYQPVGNFKVIIAIDGPAGSGKSTTAKLLAKQLGILHLDTGAMYRCITLKALRLSIPFQDEKKLGEMTKDTDIHFSIRDGIQHVFMDQEDVTEQIRVPKISAEVSDYCAVPVVRELLVEQQRKIGKSESSVLEGRDIGTVVFPDADYKFFLVADITERAKRRLKELKEKGIIKSLEELKNDIAERDRKDSTRQNSPLKKAEDAIEIDTSRLSISEQVERLISYIQKSNL